MQNSYFTKKKLINCNGNLLDLSVPKVMGILNITPDSFYDGGKFNEIEKIEVRIKQMVEVGASIIDIGAYSSRPGVKQISEKEELNRLLPVLKLINNKFSTIVFSVDTFRSDIAKIAVKEYGISIVNDISAGSFDKNMFETIADLNVPYIMMHIKGTPQNMQNNPNYDNLLPDIFTYFSEKLEILKKLAVKDVIIDPGFGFGKTIEHNYKILSELENFSIFELPILVGVSRKSMIYKYLEINQNQALNGTTVLNTIAIQKGANIIRVHDVKEAVETVKLVTKITEE